MKKLITENDILNLFKKGQNSIIIPKDSLITPAAKDKIKELGILISSEVNLKKSFEKELLSPSQTVIALGNDHNGYAYKTFLLDYLYKRGYKLVDVGSYDTKPADFPEIARRACQKIQCKEAHYAILTDATGNASAMVCNKFRGIRAATGYNEFTAKSSREHNNANVLCLGAKALGENSLTSIVDAWLTTNFGGERHQKRLDIVSEIEKANFK
ncbi:MAG: hypothetical protein AMXMBFR48_00890 [Ignavibacteriales bacterium]